MKFNSLNIRLVYKFILINILSAFIVNLVSADNIERGYFIRYTCLKCITSPTCPLQSSTFSVGYFSNNSYYSISPNDCNELTREFIINSYPTKFAFKIQIFDNVDNSTTIISDEHEYNGTEGSFNLYSKVDVGGACHSLYDVNYNVLVDNPIVITDVLFYDKVEKKELKTICGISNKTLYISYNENFYENGNPKIIQIWTSSTNRWSTIVDGNDIIQGVNKPIEIINIANYITPGDTIKIRSCKTLLNGEVSTFTYTTDTLIYGITIDPGEIESIPPDCYSEAPTIKIPVQYNIDYSIIEVNIPDQKNSFQGSDIINSLGNYYIIDKNTKPTDKEYFFELPGSASEVEIIINSPENPCPYINTNFQIENTHPLNITSHTMPEPFTDNEGNIIHIKKRGDAAEVSFEINNSRDPNLNITAIESGTETDVILPNGPDNDGYYSGTVDAKGKAGDQEFNIKNGYGCSKTFMIKTPLAQPAAITFETSHTNTTCPTNSTIGATSDGSIGIYNIDGGFGSLTMPSGFEYSNEQYIKSNCAAGNYTITISDEAGNSYTENITVNSPTAFNFNTAVLSQPTSYCAIDGKASITNSSGGTKPYKFGKVPDDVNYSISDIDFGVIHDYVYMKDAIGCIARDPITFTAAGHPTITINKIASTKHYCKNLMGSYQCKIDNNSGVIDSITCLTPDSKRVDSNNIKISAETIFIENLEAYGYTKYYTLMVFSSGCSTSHKFAITHGAIHLSTLYGKYPTCFDSENGNITIKVQNYVGSFVMEDLVKRVFDSVKNAWVDELPSLGTSHFTYNSDTVLIHSLSSGQYITTVSDDFCTYELPVRIWQKKPIELTSHVHPVKTKGTATGKIDIQLSGGNRGNHTFYVFDEIPDNQNPIEYENKAIQSGSIELSYDDAYNSNKLDISIDEIEGEASSTGKLYYIDVIDDSLCSYYQNNDRYLKVGIKEPDSLLQLSVDKIDSIACYNGTGKITLKAEGGWSDDYDFKSINITKADTVFKETASVFDSLKSEPDSLKFVVIDQYGGTDTIKVLLTQPDSLKAKVANITDNLCFGDSTGRISFDVTGGTKPYRFFINHLCEQNVDTSRINDSVLLAKSMFASEHTFRITDANECMTVYITDTTRQPDKIMIDRLAINHTTCEDTNGIISASVYGGIEPYTFKWFNDFNPNKAVDSSITINAYEKIISDSLLAANYRLQISDQNNCTRDTIDLKVDAYTNPVITSAIADSVSCYLGNNGSINFSTYKGTSPISHFTIYDYNDQYKDSLKNNILDTLVAAGFKNLIQDDYFLMAYDTIGCESQPRPIFIPEPNNLQISDISIQPVAIKGQSSGAIFGQLSGGNFGTQTVELFHESGQRIDRKWAQQNTAFVFTELIVGNYYIEAFDRKGCRFTTNIHRILEPDSLLELSLVKKANAKCKGEYGQVELKAKGGWHNFHYTLNGMDQSLSQFDLKAGQYKFVVIDSMTVKDSIVFEITEPQDSLSIVCIDSVNPTCPGNGSLTYELSGGTKPYRLYFEQGFYTTNVNSEQLISFPNLVYDSYLMNVMDTNGCKSTVQTRLTSENHFKLEAVERFLPSDKGIYDGAISTSSSGGYAPVSYSWATFSGEQLPGIESVIENITSGYYRLTASEANGCTKSQMIYLPSQADLKLNITEHQNETAYQAANGQAKFTMGLDSLTKIEITLPNDSIKVFNIQDSNRLYYRSNDTLVLQNLMPGQYLLLTKSKDIYKGYAEFEIEEYPEFVIYKSNTTNTLRVDEASGGISIFLRGGISPFNYSWSQFNDGKTDSQTIEKADTCLLLNIKAGTYVFQATDSYGNSVLDTFYILEPDFNLSLNVSEIEQQRCSYTNDAYIKLNATGGWGNYLFAKDTNQNATAQNTWINLIPGQHKFYVSDAMGVKDSLEVEISAPLDFSAQLKNVSHIKCAGQNNGQIEFSFTGGTPPYSYSDINFPISDYFIFDSIVQNRSAKTYTYAFADSNGCIAADTLNVSIIEPDSLLFDFIDITHTTCDQSNGAITMSLKGGTPPYAYNIQDAYRSVISVDSAATDLKQGAYYYLNVTDANNCLQQSTQGIKSSSRPYITEIKATPVLCFGDSNGKGQILSIDEAEPCAPFALKWSNADTGYYASDFPADVHYATISDTNNCFSTKYFRVTTPEPLNLSLLSFTDAKCFGYNDGEIITEPLGGVGGYMYSWSNGDTGPVADSLYKGFYDMLMADSNGCFLIRSYIVDEPDKLVVHLGNDLEICPGSSITLDGQNFDAHRWSMPDTVFSTERFTEIKQTSDYYLRVYDTIGCFADDTISLLVSNSALKSDFLMASDARLNDILTLYELSDVELDSMFWDFNEDAFLNVTQYNQPDYVLQLRTLKQGIYNVGLKAYHEGCFIETIKQVEILLAGDETLSDSLLGYQDPLIQEFLIAPNPNDGNFNVYITLREDADVQLSVFDINRGVKIDHREETGFKDYELSYQLNALNTGVYLVVLSAEHERKQIKIVIQ